MSSYFGVQLALELSNILPIKDVARAGYNKLVDLARDLRNSGSDIVVEEDLAEVFGRVRVQLEIEKAFKEAVKVQKIVPLFKGSEVELYQGPGPTMLRAFQESRYFATVVVLSMLGYFHGRQQLSAMIAFSLAKRFEAKVPGSSNSPGFEGIMGSLEACSTQSSEFQWGFYRDTIQEKLRQSIPDYNFGSKHYQLPKSVFLGCLDFLYIVQSLPEDRKITISSPKGCIPLIIWAHHILDLTVRITNVPGGDVIFGNANEAQIFITWSTENENGQDELQTLEPEIRLLDKDMSVHIIVESFNEPLLDLNATAERHTLRGYCTTILRRRLNHHVIAEDDDPVYAETVAFTIAYAVHISRKMYREHDASQRPVNGTRFGSRGQRIVLEMWRIVNCAKLVFEGLSIQLDKVSGYAEFLSTTKLNASSLPTTLKAYLKRDVWAGTDSKSISPESFWILFISRLATFTLVFAHVIEIESCGDIPLILSTWTPRILSICTAINSKFEPENPAMIYDTDVFHAIAGVLCDSFSAEDDRPESSGHKYHLCLCSDFGWCAHLNTVGDQDPGNIRPELVQVRRGTPVNSKTNERKLRIRDSPGFTTAHYADWDIHALEKGPNLPIRSIAKTVRSNRYWSSRTREFELTVHNVFHVSPELQSRGMGKEADECYGYRELQQNLWKTFTTPTCEHYTTAPIFSRTEGIQILEIGPDAAGLLAWSLFGEFSKRYHERIIVLLTEGDPALRWAALCGCQVYDKQSNRRRKIMLRTDECCPSCALDYVGNEEGEWALIL
jgi:hypothetical protein